MFFERMKDKHVFFSNIKTLQMFIRDQTKTRYIRSQLKYFQFKVLHGIVYTNNHSYRIGIAQTNLCCFCKREEEICRHFVRLIWNDWNNK